MFSLERIGQQVIVFGAVVGCDLRTSVLEQQGARFLEKFNGAVRQGQVVILTAGEDPQAMVGDFPPHFHVRPDRGGRDAQFLKAGLGATDDHQIDLPLRSKFIVAMLEVVGGEGQFTLPAACRRFEPAVFSSVERRCDGVTLGPQHGAAVIRCGCGQRLLRGEGHEGWQTGDVRHGPVRRVPFRPYLFANPIAQDRPICEVVHLTVEVNEKVGGAVSFEVQTPTRRKSGQGSCESGEPGFSVGDE